MARDKRPPATPLLEWLSAAIGLTLILGLIAVIGWEALHGGTDEPPSIELAIVRIVPAASGYMVEIEARNESGGTAAAVEVEGALKDGAATRETSATTFDYVPGHSVRSGGLFFREDPRRHRLELRALGFQTP